MKNKTWVEFNGRRKFSDDSIPWDLFAPFVFNPQARLIHRCRSIVTHTGPVNPGRLIIDYWCGGCHYHGHDDDLHFDFPDVSRILCARCEAIAVVAGEKSADEICGKHIHVGGIVVEQYCCQKKKGK